MSERVPVTDWPVYERLERFTHFDAAALWLELEPTQTLQENPPPALRLLMEDIEQTAGRERLVNDWFIRQFSGSKPSPPPNTVSRAWLQNFATKRGQRPRFLFGRPEPESLDARSEKTYLKVIRALWNRSGIEQTGTALSNATGVSPETCRRIIKKIQELED